MSRAKNAINVIMKNTATCASARSRSGARLRPHVRRTLTGLFGTDRFFPGAKRAIDYAWLFFQTMFAAIAATIVGRDRRARPLRRLIPRRAVTGIVYPAICAWGWGSLYDGEGWLRQMGFIDFAAPTVVHPGATWSRTQYCTTTARVPAATARRKACTIPGHNLTSVALGGFIRWPVVLVQRREYGRRDRSNRRSFPRLAIAVGAIGAIVALRVSDSRCCSPRR